MLGVVRSNTGLFLGAVVFLAMIALAPPAGMSAKAWHVSAVGILMAIWWISEAIPVYATGLLPLVLFPLLGVLPIKNAAAPYANPLIFLFLGGFMIALAMQRWNLHRRIALNLLRLTGTKTRGLIGGFMLTSALLSMWVSNTATAIMMVPIGLSVTLLLRRDADNPATEKFESSLVLSIAYGASIGGMATLIGTPPNALMAGYFSSAYGYTIGFAEWMAAALPLSLVLLFLSWLVLTRFVFRLPSQHVEGADIIIRQELKALGPLGRGEKITAVVFVSAALAWILQPLIQKRIPGVELSDAGIAMIAALALFIVPVDLKNRTFTLDWDSMREIPWGVLLLFGGGLSLAAAVTASGLAPWIADSLKGLSALSTFAMLLAVVAAIVFLTELTSNTATTAAILPLLAGVAVGIGESPLLLAVPATLAASCAFMLPAATPPNAIVFGSGKVTIPQMARTGFWLNILAIAAIALFSYTVMQAVFEIELGKVPAWAQGKG